MKKGDRVRILSNPKNDGSTEVGIATLISFDNNEVYLDDSHGYENWLVDINGMKRNHLLHPRHLVKE